MRNLVSGLDQWLPPWFEKTPMLWIQWVYALWQLLRCNRLALFVLSFLPFFFRQRCHKKNVVALGASKDYDMPYEEMYQYFTTHQLKSLEFKKKLGDWFCYVKHGRYFYLTHPNNLCELGSCLQLFGEDNLIFVERLLPVTASVAVGKRLSQTEAYERIFSRRYHCGKGNAYVVPTGIDYVDLSSTFWRVLSSIPILLQAGNYNRLSNSLSLVIILLDLSRAWLFKLYDRLFDSFVKFVKLNIFKQRTTLYNIFSAFSSRWKYSDTVKKYAYVAKPDEKVLLRSNNKLESMDDIRIEGFYMHDRDPNNQHICMEIVKNTAQFSLMEFGIHYARAVLNKPVYVS